MRRLVALLLLTLLLAGCSRGGLPWREDFDAPGSWRAESDATAQVGIADGVLRIYIAVPNQLAWAAAGRDWRDVHLTVEATQVAGPDDNEYGVLMRFRDAGNFYRFSISGDGYYLITKFVDGSPEPLGANWRPSEAIHQGQATNVIEVICQGSTLTLRVNGQELAQVQDSQFSHGDIALYAGSFYESGVEVHFDNLTLVEP